MERKGLGIIGFLIPAFRSIFFVLARSWPPYKNKKGDRYFTKKDIETIRTIYHLTKEKGYTLQGAKDAIKGAKFVDQLSKADLVQTLKNINEFLLEIKEEL